MAEREEMLRETTRHIPNIEVVSFHGLLNEYAIDMVRPSLFAASGPERF